MTAATDSMSPVVEKKKKNVSKRLKKSWRKHIDFKDVDEFLDKQRQEERIGGPASLKKDEDLFVIDVLPEKESRVEKNLPLTKKQRALLPMTCYKGLESLTAVPDPIVKRNRVRTKAERESIIVKQNRMKKHMSGVESEKVVRARLDRQRALKQKKAQPKGVVFPSDLWDQKETKLDLDWLNKDTLEHNLSKTGRFKIRAPRGILTKKSVLPSLEIPHPGTSYNPSVTDHQALLREVADKELEKQKNEAHLERVTSACFTKVTPEEKQARWVEEMSQGLVKVEEDDEVEIKEEQLSDDENTNENLRLSIGPPSNRLKAKTRKQRRIQRRLRDEAQKRKEAKVEKKKISDVYRIRLVKGSVDKMDQKQQLMAERRKKLAEAHKGRTKRLGRQQYVEPDVDFSRPCELRSRLNLVKKQGNLLADRYLSLQKRNMLAPGTKQIKKRKAKVKRFVKASHKMEEDLPQKKKKTRQVK